MRRTIRNGGVFIGVVAMTLGIFSFQDASPQATGQTLNLNFPKSQPDAISDLAPKGPSIGDVLYFTGALTDEAGAKAGHLFAEASSFAKGGGLVQMTATLALHQGSLNAVGELNLQSNDQGTLSIVGGTGDHEGARGSAVITRDPTTNNINIDITLLP